MEELKKWKEFLVVSYASKRDARDNMRFTDHGVFRYEKKARKELEMLKVAWPRRIFRIYKYTITRMCPVRTNKNLRKQIAKRP